ncbi:hypothetical protein MARINOS108_20048 [Marinoscillum sp. 108]|nr:hypothetical protein MARINOS108_20048 [Marinoscillum sp. 108]
MNRVILTLFVLVSFESMCQTPALIKYPTCAIARELAKEELKGDTINYFHFGDFRNNSQFHIKIDSLARSMGIRLAHASHQSSLDCYNEVVKSHFSDNNGIDNIWVYLNIKTDSLLNLDR